MKASKSFTLKSAMCSPAVHNAFTITPHTKQRCVVIIKNNNILNIYLTWILKHVHSVRMNS